MAKIGIIGAGSWGTALAVLLHKNGHEITIWSIIESEIQMLKENRILPAEGEDVDAKFLTNPLNQQELQVLANNIKDLIKGQNLPKALHFTSANSADLYNSVFAFLNSSLAFSSPLKALTIVNPEKTSYQLAQEAMELPLSKAFDQIPIFFDTTEEDS